VFSVRTNTHPIFHIDWLMLMAAGAVTALGLLMIYSSTRTRLELNSTSTLYYVERQGLALGIGIVLALIASVVDYRKLQELWPLLYGATLPLLFVVALRRSRPRQHDRVVQRGAVAVPARRRSPSSR